ncbi:MAG TPA: MFS transporter [Amycolatopsis sp.]|uniref:MFS transporter n=1 Tax=Amycolatopsis sp. TaxID=37632 RepID=UPI002B4765F7|nr:MFS transporter [Amycolatopsis sp.]HKS50077.1 MFS transporter [Amycolatopsis sp.]
MYLSRERPVASRNLVALLYSGSLSIAIAYGFLLLLPAYLKYIGGDEAEAGRILACGAVGAIVAVALTGRFCERVGPSAAAATGSAVYALGTGAICLSSQVSAYLYLAGVLLGVGWALFFTAAPIALSTFVPGDARGRYFSVLAGFNALGMGLAPVLGDYLRSVSVPYSTIFLAATVLNVASTLFFLLLARKFDGSWPRSRPGQGTVLGPWRTVLASPARPFFVMVFLGACVFTAMQSFNSTYAASRGLSYSIFYGAYTLGVIVPRFTVSGFIARQNPHRTTIVLLALMCLSVAGFLAVNGNPLVYGFSSALLGMSYGLVYPLIQAQAVAVSEADVEHWVLSYFSLAYFAAVFGFPLVAGAVIVHWGYQTMFGLLVAIALGELTVAIRQSVRKPA